MESSSESNSTENETPSQGSFHQKVTAPADSSGNQVLPRPLFILTESYSSQQHTSAANLEYYPNTSLGPQKNGSSSNRAIAAAADSSGNQPSHSRPPVIYEYRPSITITAQPGTSYSPHINGNAPYYSLKSDEHVDSVPISYPIPQSQSEPQVSSAVRYHPYNNQNGANLNNSTVANFINTGSNTVAPVQYDTETVASSTTSLSPQRSNAKIQLTEFIPIRCDNSKIETDGRKCYHCIIGPPKNKNDANQFSGSITCATCGLVFEIGAARGRNDALTQKVQTQPQQSNEQSFQGNMEMAKTDLQYGENTVPFYEGVSTVSDHDEQENAYPLPPFNSIYPPQSQRNDHPTFYYEVNNSYSPHPYDQNEPSEYSATPLMQGDYPQHATVPVLSENSQLVLPVPIGSGNIVPPTQTLVESQPKQSTEKNKNKNRNKNSKNAKTSSPNEASKENIMINVEHNNSAPSNIPPASATIPIESENKVPPTKTPVKLQPKQSTEKKQNKNKNNNKNKNSQSAKTSSANETSKENISINVELSNSTPSNIPPTSAGATNKPNVSPKPKNFPCQPCNKWFETTAKLRRHCATALHSNTVGKGRSSVSDDANTDPNTTE